MDTIDALIAKVGDKPLAMARLASVLKSKGRDEQARELCEKALSLAPRDGEIRVLAAEILSQGVPVWYFPMVRDHARHAMYEAAFRRAIRPGDLVLDIGSGTGVFAMLAARAGARVVTCEAKPHVARIVGDVVARNGFADRITVVPKLSQDIQIGRDIDRPADVIVWDNLANNLMGAGALPTTEGAMRSLSHDGTRIIPRKGAIRAALAEDRHVVRMTEPVEGFDMSPFNLCAPPRYNISPRYNDAAQTPIRSDAADLFVFDFGSGGPFPEASMTVRMNSHGGPVNGAIQWTRWELDDYATYENAPPLDPDGAMGAIFHAFDRSFDTQDGNTFKIGASHNREALRIWPADK
jgi:type II protein arginine methyltransferase